MQSQDFHYYLQVRYGECDAQKVVFNARYGDYVDLAASEYLRAICPREQLPQGEFDYQVVKLTIVWKASARFRDVLAIAVRTSHIGNTSFTMDLDIHNQETGQLLATAEMTGVAVDVHTVEKMTIPEAMRDAMTADGKGLRIDHAGLFSA